MNGRHSRPRPNLLTRAKVVIARVLVAAVPAHPDPPGSASSTSPEATLTDDALATLEPGQTPPHQD